MKDPQVQLKAVSKELGKLSKQVEKLAAQVAKQAKAKPAPKKKAVKKAAAKKAKKAAPKKATANKTSKKATVLDAVFDVVRRARNGATIAQLKLKTGLNPRQLSNALYKLSTRGKIIAKSRGVYVKK